MGDEAEIAFAQIDVCQDQKISIGELQLVDLVMHHQPLDIDHSDHRVVDLYKELNIDEDGHISKDEWMENWETICEAVPGLVDEKFAIRMDQLFHIDGPKEVPLYATGGISTFFSKPVYGKPGQRPPADCVFFGCPFDAGSSYRSGSRFGPKVIRETSQMLLTNCGSDYAPWADKNFGKLRIYDGGDAAPTPFDLMTAVKQIYVCTKVLWNTASKVVAVGGDHTLSWSFLAAARDKNNGKPVPIVHLDAHYDTGTEYLGSKLSHGTALGRAGSGGCIDYERSTHVGIRGIDTGPGLADAAAELGYRTITMDEFSELGPAASAEVCKARIGDEPCVIILDLDCMDTSDCPGVGFPTPGGIRNRELITFLRTLMGLNVMGGVVVEYTPDYDPSKSTAMIAAQGAYEIMALALADTPEREEGED